MTARQDAGIDADAAVVGAGFAGLTAARRIAESGKSVVVLEARERIGGRTETIDVAGTLLDIGGQWVGPGQDRLYALAAEVGAATFPQYAKGDAVLVREDEPMRIADVAVAFSDRALGAYVEAVSEIEAMAATVQLDAPWSTPRALEFDGQTLETWMQASIADVEARDLLRLSVQAVFATEPANLSLLHCLVYVASAGGWSYLTDTEGGAQQDRFVAGTAAVAAGLRRLVEEAGGIIRLGSPVHRVRQHHDGVAVAYDGGEARANRVVVAVPPTLAARIHYDPPLPAARDQLTQRMPAGSVIKFHVVYERPWWRDDGLSGQVLAVGDRIDVTFDGSPSDGRVGVITGFFEGVQAIAAESLGEAGRRSHVIGLLRAALGDAAAQPIAYVDRSWSAEQWTRGCYGAHLPPGAWTQLGPALRPACGRIHWAGTETAVRWAGYVEGAIDSGERAAAEVLDALR